MALAPTAFPTQDILDEVVDMRRWFHRRPEIGFEEHATSAEIRSRLAALGLKVLQCPTETGAVAVLETGNPGRTVMLRADIDALPIQEDSGVAFASLTEGRMHACGHDCHAAILLGTARTLAERAESLPGRYLFVFQPAEEIVSGARAMIDGGLLDLMTIDTALGLHVASFLPARAVVARGGVQWSGADAYEMNFLGPGGHGGMMRRAGNVIAAQAFFVERLGSVVDGLVFEGVECHTTIGEIHSDGAFNVVPRRVTLRGSLRTFSPDLRETALQRLRDLMLETQTEFSIKVEMDIKYRTIPLVNDPDVTRLVLDAGREVVGDHAFAFEQPMTVSDDMAEFLVNIPGCYFTVGAKPPDAEVAPAHHSPTFRVDEDALEIGVRVLSSSAARLSVPGLPAAATPG